MANLQLEHHSLRVPRSGVGLGYGDKEDGEIYWKVRNVALKGAGEEGKDAATVDRRNAACCRKRFVEEGLSLPSWCKICGRGLLVCRGSCCHQRKMP